MSGCFSRRRLSAHAAAILVALPLAFATGAKAFTIDFEGGEPGEPLPDSYCTPLGDVEFTNGVILDNPIGPGTKMASQIQGPVAEDGSTAFSFIIWASVAEVRLTFVNPDVNDIYVQYFETSSGDLTQDYGAHVPGQDTSVVVLDQTIDPGGDFYGASFEFENRCQGGFDVAACTTNWGLDSIEIVPEPGTAEIDIKPGSYPNSINLKSKGVIPVAILTSEGFDAFTVDPDTVAFGRAEAEKRHKGAHLDDVDGDGDLDLVLHFRTRGSGIAPGDTDACVTGQTYDGVPIMACDCVRTVPPK